MPQPPQWLGSLEVRTQEPLHSVVPGGQVQTPPMHMPAPQANLVRQESPRLPTQESPSQRPLQHEPAVARSQKPPAEVQLRFWQVPEMQRPMQQREPDMQGSPVATQAEASTPASPGTPPSRGGLPSGSGASGDAVPSG